MAQAPLHDGYTPVSRGDVAEENPDMILGELRGLRRDLTAHLNVIDNRLGVFIKQTNDRLDDIKSDLADLRAGHEAHEALLHAHSRTIAKLQKKPRKRPATGRGKKRK